MDDCGWPPRARGTDQNDPKSQGVGVTASNERKCGQRHRSKELKPALCRWVVRASTEKPAISVIGLGYVGAVSMACLAHLGFRMVGVDVSTEKVAAIAEGRSPIVEDRLGELLAEGVDSGLITATENLVAAVLETDVTFMSVGTPTSADGSCDLTYVRQAARAIGQALCHENRLPRRRPALLRAAGHDARRRRSRDREGLRPQARRRLRHVLQPRVPARRRRRRRLLRPARRPSSAPPTRAPRRPSPASTPPSTSA